MLAAGVVAAGLVAAPVPARATTGPVEVSGVTYILTCDAYPDSSDWDAAAIALGGLVVPLFRELRETWYQFGEPWTTDSTRTEAALGVRATPLAEGAEVTVAWWRSRVDGGGS